jgi:UDP-N-acetylmuramate dehydrogenase
MHWFAGLEAICRTDVPLRHHTWYRLGGPARWFFEPRDDADLAIVLERCRAHDVPWRVLGRGANLLVRDDGFPGAVICLGTQDAHGSADTPDPGAAPGLASVRYDGPRVHAGAGASFTHLVKDAIRRGLCGLEALAGIPGSVGGVIRMNAGGKYGEIASFVRTVRLIDAAGQLVNRTREQLGFRYRHSDLDGCVVLAATLELTPGDAAAANARFKQIWNEKYATQPPVSARSAGCIFKNPPGNSAGRLIDQAGLKGERIGGAEFSSKHANFIVAHEGASARDVLDLIALAKDRVWNASGVELQLEVEVW